MIVTHLKLMNWRNFQRVDVPLRNRMFLAGPNASGKSNLLDVFRFMRDVAKPGGGLQTAVEERGGLTFGGCKRIGNAINATTSPIPPPP